MLQRAGCWISCHWITMYNCILPTWEHPVTSSPRTTSLRSTLFYGVTASEVIRCGPPRTGTVTLVQKSTFEKKKKLKRKYSAPQNKKNNNSKTKQKTTNEPNPTSGEICKEQKLSLQKLSTFSTFLDNRNTPFMLQLLIMWLHTFFFFILGFCFI